MKYLRCSIINLLLLILLSAGYANAFHQGAYPFKLYSVRDGLSHNQTSVIYQDRDGYIWIGTFAGLSRYDGRSFHNFSRDDGLPSSYILAITQDHQGRIWVGTNQGVAVLENNSFKTVPLSNFTPQPTVMDILADPDGNIYIATRLGLIRIRDGKQTLYTHKEGLLSTRVYALAQASNGDLIIGTRGGLNVMDNGTITSRPQLNRNENDYIVDIFIDPHNGDILLTRKLRLTVLHTDGSFQDIAPSTTPDSNLICVTRDRQGATWIGSTDGLFLMEPGHSPQRLTRENGLSDNWINNLMVDYEGNLWACSDLGVMKLSTHSITIYTQTNGLKSNIIWSVIRLRDQLVLGTEQGLQVMSPDGSLSTAVLTDRPVICMSRLPEDRLLLGTGHGIFLYENGRPRPASTDRALMDSAIHRIVPLSDGTWLLAATTGCYQGNINQFREIPLPDFARNTPIYDIVQLGETSWWLCTSRGLLTLRRSPQGFAFDRDFQMKGQELQCALRLKDGNILFGTIGSGAYRWDGHEFTRIHFGLSPKSDNIWSIFQDNQGILWFGTSRGLVFIAGGRVHDFNAIFGLQTDEVTSRQSIFQDTDSSIYFGTARGLLHFRPGPRPSPIPPRLYITHIAINQQEQPLGRTPVRLRYDSSLELQFKCLSFINEYGNRYQFRLVGVDPDWRPPTRDDHVMYPYLPPGKLQFMLRAINSRGDLSARVLTLPIEVTPAFTQTIWFYILLILGVGLIIGAFVGYKTLLDRREREKLRSMVQQKTTELQTSEEKYRHLVEASLIGIVIIQNRRIVFVNPQIAHLFKYRYDELLDRAVDTLVHEDDLPVMEENLQLLEKGDTSPHEYELRIHCGDGSIRTFLIHSTITLYSERPAILANMVDVTEKKRMQEQLIHYQKLESIGTLAGGIAHDFNNILQGITGHTSLLRLQLTPGDAMQEELAMIEEAANKAAGLTRKLLGFARKGKYVVTIFDIHPVIDSVIALSRRTIPLNIEFVREYSDSPLFVQGDRSQFEQVFLNLFLNSRDAISDKGQICIVTGMETIPHDIDMGNHVLTQGDYILITITDTGSGIPENVLPKIFDPFFTTKPSGKGSGLGLATVYGIVKNHQGYIYFDSPEHGGTRATIYIPQASVSEVEIGSTSPDTDHLSTGVNWLAGRSVLVVEDETINRKFLSKLLTKNHMTVFEAENGQQALQLFRARHREIDIILLDVNMPVMDGKEALNGLFAAHEGVPVIILSGYGEDQKIQEMMQLGCRDFIQKPVDPRRLIRMIDAILAPDTEDGGN